MTKTAAESKRTDTAPQEIPLPQSGGSYTYDPDSNTLTRTPQPGATPAANLDANKE